MDGSSDSSTASAASVRDLSFPEAGCDGSGESAHLPTMQDGDGAAGPSRRGEEDRPETPPCDPPEEVEGLLATMNQASEDVNRLESELSSAQATYKETLRERTAMHDRFVEKVGRLETEKVSHMWSAQECVGALRHELQEAAVAFGAAIERYHEAQQHVQRCEAALARPASLAEDDAQNNARIGEGVDGLSRFAAATMAVFEAQAERDQALCRHDAAVRGLQAAETVAAQARNGVPEGLLELAAPMFAARDELNAKLLLQKERVEAAAADLARAKTNYRAAMCGLEELSKQIHERRGTLEEARKEAQAGQG
mmetsp:Transcript_36142/g.94646  ORF Transcript_36142/g.94646 Transcript_36142/m.94646 type:complete len:311 (+) Transcript_36142:20-952(+)